jgi:hypothetical protein
LKFSAVSRQRNWQLAEEGRIPAKRGNPGGKHYRYYNSAALAEWMENCWGGVLDGKIIRIPNVLISLG